MISMASFSTRQPQKGGSCNIEHVNLPFTTQTTQRPEWLQVVATTNHILYSPWQTIKIPSHISNSMSQSQICIKPYSFFSDPSPFLTLTAPNINDPCTSLASCCVTRISASTPIHSQNLHTLRLHSVPHLLPKLTLMRPLPFLLGE